MIKLMFCLRRLPSLTAEQFHSYWLNEHAALVRQHSPALSIKRYVQNHTLVIQELHETLLARGAEVAPYDGVAELWWESLEDLIAVGKNKESRIAGRALLADERRFIDMSNSPIFYSTEHVII